MVGVHCRPSHQGLRSDRAAVECCADDLQDWAAQEAVPGASVAFERHSRAVHQRKVFEVAQVLAEGFQDEVAWYAAGVYDFVEAGIGFVGTGGVEKRRKAHSGDLEAHFETQVEARSERVMDHFETDSVVRSGKEMVHSGTVEDRFGMEDRSEIEEVVRLEIEVESQAPLAGGIVEACQTLGFEVDQNSAVAG